jgi:Fe-S-cluster formation regulator IscX/YfhJ
MQSPATSNADAAAVQTVASVQATEISSSESVRQCWSDSRTHAEELSQAHPDADSVSARILNVQVSLNQKVESLDVSDQPAPLQAACHRKLQFGADARESPPAAPSPPVTRDCSTANEDGSSSLKPHFASPSASEFEELEEAAAVAAAAHEHQRVAHWVSFQAREISETDLPLTAENHEALQQRLQEQKLWGMINSTILSDLMRSLGAKSIFYP